MTVAKLKSINGRAKKKYGYINRFFRHEFGHLPLLRKPICLNLITIIKEA